MRCKRYDFVLNCWTGEIVWEGVAGLTVHIFSEAVKKLTSSSEMMLVKGIFVGYILLRLMYDYWLEAVNEEATQEDMPDETECAFEETVTEKVNKEERDFIGTTHLSKDQKTTMTMKDTINVGEASKSPALEVKDVHPSIKSEDPRNESECKQVNDILAETREYNQYLDLPRVDETKQTIQQSVNIKNEMITFSQKSQLVNILTRRRQGVEQQNQPHKQPLIHLRETTTIISQQTGQKRNATTQSVQIDQHVLLSRCKSSQQCDNEAEEHTHLFSEKGINAQGPGQHDTEESRNKHDLSQDSKGLLSLRLQDNEGHGDIFAQSSKRMKGLGKHQDLESMADHYQTCRQESETGTCHSESHTGRNEFMEDFRQVHMQEAYDVKNRQCGQEVHGVHRQKNCNPHSISIPCTNNCAHAISEVDLSDLYDLGTLSNKSPYKVHKSNKTDTSQLSEEEMNMKSYHSQQLDLIEDTEVFVPLVEEEMEKTNYDESCDPLPLFQTFEERANKETNQSQHVPNQREMEGFSHLQKEETEYYQNCIDPHYLKVRDEESCVGEEHTAIKEPCYGAELKDMESLFDSLKRKTEDEQSYIAPSDTKVGIRETIDGKVHSIVHSESHVEETQDDKEQCSHSSDQEIRESCIKDESPGDDKKNIEIFIHPLEAVALENYIESNNTRVKIEETLDRERNTIVHSKETLYDDKPSKATFCDDKHLCEQEVEKPCIKDLSRTHTQESENVKNLNETGNVEHQLTRSPRVKITYNSTLTMKGNQKND
ncbi:uncharacterized protein LOC135215318 isoform X2 [Macrobrachium nipponense]|uniref:uncharacterized protein LOC135215318 isoform X2 n=1 Tax=Macrobrachium nipponense TaxID=159736 RepID=UPI0030C88C09